MALTNVSPRFTTDKLENASIDDKLDVFEDQTQGWILSQAEKLLDSPDGNLASLMVTCSYFEMIAAFLTGEETEKKSKDSFRHGFLHVFRHIGPIDTQRTPGSPLIDVDKVIDWFYKQLRCGLFHEAMIGGQVVIGTYQAAIAVIRNEGSGEFC